MLMKKLVLDIEKIDWTKFHPTRNYCNFKVDYKTKKILIANKDQLLHKFVESSVIFEYSKCKFVLDGLKNDKISLLNLKGPKVYDFQMKTKGDKVWKLKSINTYMDTFSDVNIY